jgi:hypothetical protein
MANEAAVTQTINIVPVQGIFQPEPTFALVTLIGPAGTPFYANINPNQSGLHITDSTIDSSPIGSITPSTGVFTNVDLTTGTITSAPSGPTSIVNQAYVDAVAQGLAFKQPANFTTTGNITLSGLAVQAGGDWPATLTAGDRILVKDQTTGANNGIYVAAAGAWSRASDANTYAEYLAAYLFVLSGTLYGGSAWVCTNQPGGTLGVTPITFTQFSNNALYTAGTGLTLAGYQFSITNIGTAGTYGSASQVPVFVTNAQGQVTGVTNTAIAIANTQVSGLGTMSTQNANSVAITGGAIDGTAIGGTTAAAVTGTIVTASTYFTGPGTGLTGTASGLSIGGNAATATSATSATTATNLAGGATGSVPYQTAFGTTGFLAAGANGQVLTLAAGVPSWATPTTGTVTSVSGTGTVSGLTLTGTVTTSGSLTLGGTLDLSSPPAIGGTLANTITGTTITATTKFVGPYFDAANSAGGALRNASGTAQLQWGGGGGNNITVDVAANINPANAQVDISPTGTGTVRINPVGGLGIAPIAAGTMNNVVIGGTTPLAGTFTTLRFNTTLSVNGSSGTSGQVLTSSGAGLPTWTTPTAYATVTDDTTTNATRYPLFANQTAGNLTTEFVSSTKLQFNPSTGVFSATSFTGAGTGLTGTASSLSIGGNAATATTATSATTATNLDGGAANRIPYQTGAANTSFIAAPTTASTVLTWNGSGFTWSAAAGGVTISDDTTTNATRYLTFVDVTTGTVSTEYVASSKLSFNPSTGTLSVSGTMSATAFSGSGASLTSLNASNLSTGTVGTARLATGTANATTFLRGDQTWAPLPYSVEVVIVAGGGSGGATNGGGGGAGGVVYVTGAQVQPSSSTTVTVGAGGAGSTSGGNSGNDSVFGIYTAVAGGAGQGVIGGQSTNGGSGGGGQGEAGTAGGTATAGQGSNGGAGQVSPRQSAGGGGKGAAGQDGSAGGAGGIGTNDFTTWATATSSGASGFFAGGGGGGTESVSRTAAGGTGGGGASGNASNGVAGTANTGGGGGGGSRGSGSTGTYAGGAGGSGIVIVRYPGAQRGSGGTVYTYAGYTYHKFTSSGTYTG